MQLSAQNAFGQKTMPVLGADATCSQHIDGKWDLHMYQMLVSVSSELKLLCEDDTNHMRPSSCKY